MEFQVSSGFFERMGRVDAAHALDGLRSREALVVSPRGTVVEKSVIDSWAKGTFLNPVDSLEHHFAKHARGRTRRQYTLDALRFFSEHKDKAEWGRWNPSWSEAFRIKVGSRGGYFTPGGRILSYWDDYGISKDAV